MANEEQLDVFKFDPEFLQNEEKYREIKHEILGDSSDEEDGSAGDDEEEEEESDEEEQDGGEDQEDKRDRRLKEIESKMEIHDKTETNLINLRKTVYLTIMSSLDFEEACHKLMRMALRPGQEVEEWRFTERCTFIVFIHFDITIAASSLRHDH